MKKIKIAIIKKSFFPNFILDPVWGCIVILSLMLWILPFLISIFSSDGSCEQPIELFTTLFGGVIFLSFIPTRPTSRLHFLILFIGLFFSLVLVLVNFYSLVLNEIIPNNWGVTLYRAFVLALIITLIKGAITLIKGIRFSN